MNKSESITKISAALVKSQSEMGGASKGASNPFFKSKYADLNSVREACIPVLNANGITVLQPTTVSDTKAYVETILLHESGEFLASLTEIIANKQNDAQAHGSGVSYARRYGLQSFLCIGSEDDDGEKAHGRGTGKVSEHRGGLSSGGSIQQNNGTLTVSAPLKTTGITDMVDKATSNTMIPPNVPIVEKKGFGVKTKVVEVPEVKTTDAWE